MPNISLLRLYRYQNDFTGKSIPKTIQLTKQSFTPGEGAFE